MKTMPAVPPLPGNIADLLSRYGDMMYMAGREAVSRGVRLAIGVGVAGDNDDTALGARREGENQLREKLVDAIREALP